MCTVDFVELSFLWKFRSCFENWKSIRSHNVDFSVYYRSFWLIENCWSTISESFGNYYFFELSVKCQSCDFTYFVKNKFHSYEITLGAFPSVPRLTVHWRLWVSYLATEKPIFAKCFVIRFVLDSLAVHHDTLMYPGMYELMSFEESMK